MEYVIVNRLSAGTLFKILSIGTIGVYVVLGLALMIMTILGYPLQAVDGESIGMIKSILFIIAFTMVGIITSPMWSAILWLCIWPGLKVYSMFSPMKIRYIKHEKNIDA